MAQNNNVIFDISCQDLLSEYLNQPFPVYAENPINKLYFQRNKNLSKLSSRILEYRIKKEEKKYRIVVTQDGDKINYTIYK